MKNSVSVRSFLYSIEIQNKSQYNATECQYNEWIRQKHEYIIINRKQQYRHVQQKEVKQMMEKDAKIYVADHRGMVGSTDRNRAGRRYQTCL